MRDLRDLCVICAICDLRERERDSYCGQHSLARPD